MRDETKAESRNSLVLSRELAKSVKINQHEYMKLNQIYQGDNLHFMKDMKDESIDLIYIDPPFGTQSLWSSKAWNGQKIQEMAFYDSWGGVSMAI